MKSRPIAVSSRRSTPRPTIRAISAWRTVTWQAVGRDADRHHPARDRHGLEDGDRIAEPCEVVRGRHAGRPAADDADLFRAAGRGRGDRWQLAVLGGEALERADRDRFVEHAPTAGAFARRGADPAADRRERIDLGRDRVRVVVATGGDQTDIAAGIRAGRAGDLAWSLGGRSVHRPSSTARPATPRRGEPFANGTGRPTATDASGFRDSRVTVASGSHARGRSPLLTGARSGPDGAPGPFRRAAATSVMTLDRAFADADAAADAFADLDRVLHHPGLRRTEPSRLDAGTWPASTCRAPRPDTCPCRCRS